MARSVPRVSTRERPPGRPRCRPALEPLVFCPDFGLPAWVEWRDDVGSTGGPLVHVKVRCFGRHWFLMPEQWLHLADVAPERD